MISDALLRTYVDEVFMTYDRDRSGSLETNELAHFFNDVFEKMNSNERFTSQQARNAIMQVDTNFDGRASKNELFNALKRMMSQSSSYNSYSNSSYNYNSQGNQGYQGYQQTYTQPSTAYNQQYSSSNTSYNQPELNNAASMLSTGYSGNYMQNKENNTFFNDTTSKLQPQSLINNLQPSTISQPSYNTNILNTTPTYINKGTLPGSYITNTPTSQIITSSTVNNPGYTKITTVEGPGYSKITTETYTSSNTYKY